MIYMDHNATTPLDKKVLEAMKPFLTDSSSGGQKYGNASSVHSMGREARDAVEKARGQVAELIGAHPKEIIFTSGGTEADNQALMGVVVKYLTQQEHGTGCIVISQVEHKAVLDPCQGFPRLGVPVLYAPVNRIGRIEPDKIRMATQGMKRKLILISLMHANNETGTIQPVGEASEIAHEMGALVHTDAVQSLGKIPVNVDDLGVDLLSMSAHKIHGPKGIGALYVSEGIEVASLISGGHQEGGRRAGTENVPAIVGFGKAAEIARDIDRRFTDWLFAATRELYYGIQEAIQGVDFNGDPDSRLPNTINLSFRGVYNEALLLLLDAEGFAASSGSACTSGSLHGSHVLKAMGCDSLAIDGAVRFSLGRANFRPGSTITGTDVEALLKILPGMVKELRAMRGAQMDRVKDHMGEVSHAIKQEVRGPGCPE